ncbi:MAG: hypothetical protein HQL46_16865 [Gammaproteobacteria bacterium]|nr:hypothetical protein [Gammaproteobacteria bacterium]
MKVKLSIWLIATLTPLQNIHGETITVDIEYDNIHNDDYTEIGVIKHGGIRRKSNSKNRTVLNKSDQSQSNAVNNSSDDEIYNTPLATETVEYNSDELPEFTNSLISDEYGDYHVIGLPDGSKTGKGTYLGEEDKGNTFTVHNLLYKQIDVNKIKAPYPKMQ